MRLPSLLAVAGIALVLAWLGLGAGGPHALPALVFLSFGSVIQYGRTGEVDLRRRALRRGGARRLRARPTAGRRLAAVDRRAVVRGRGCAHQGLAPALFHTPALVTTWRRRLRLRPLALVLGLLVMLALALAWVLPYARSSSAAAVAAQLGARPGTRPSSGGIVSLPRQLAALTHRCC